MSQLPPAAAPAVPLVVVAYDLRDGSNGNASLTPPNIVELPPSARISHLQQAVFAAARALLPERYSYLGLDVYPPGSTDWTDRSAAVDAEEELAQLLPAPHITDRSQRRFIVIARPPPSFGGARGQSSHLPHAAFPVICPRRLLADRSLPPFPPSTCSSLSAVCVNRFCREVADDLCARARASSGGPCVQAQQAR